MIKPRSYAALDLDCTGTRQDPSRVPQAVSKPWSPSQAVAHLLDWFGRAARDLPWRHCRDPYGIWVSEVMLQQTQVQTVIPYWERWMRTFPTLTALANAPEDRVIKLWEGLGYYRRARHMHRAAKMITDTYGGIFPRELERLNSLPGVGRYTAGAIASIAFNQPAPILDGNLIRVLTRLYALEGDPRSKALTTRLWSLAEDLVREAAKPSYQNHEHRLAAGACSALNQSLMELGATVCTPRKPLCEQCPLGARCLARRLGNPEEFPQVRQAPPATLIRLRVIVFRRGKKVALVQRPLGGVNELLWEFPSDPWPAETSGSPVAPSVVECLTVEPEALKPLGKLRHAITRYRIQLEVFTVSEPPRKSLPGARWFTLRELEELPLSSAHRKIARMITA